MKQVLVPIIATLAIYTITLFTSEVTKNENDGSDT